MGYWKNQDDYVIQSLKKENLKRMSALLNLITGYYWNAN